MKELLVKCDKIVERSSEKPTLCRIEDRVHKQKLELYLTPEKGKRRYRITKTLPAKTVKEQILVALLEKRRVRLDRKKKLLRVEVPEWG